MSIATAPLAAQNKAQPLQPDYAKLYQSAMANIPVAINVYAEANHAFAKK